MAAMKKRFAALGAAVLLVLSLYGGQDGVLNLEKYGQYLKNLSENAKEVVIEGGNHANFAAYGPQEGDGEASLSPEEQQAITAAAILDFLNGR